MIKKLSQSPIMAYYGIAFEYGRSQKDGKTTLRYELPWKPICCHSNQQSVFKWSYNCLFIRLRWVWQVWKTLKENIAIFVAVKPNMLS